jgi:hypothetical protein
MSRASRLRGVAALLLACLLGTWGIGSMFASAALADDGPAPTPAPVTVTIPDLSGQTPTPTPSPSSSSNSPSYPQTGDRGGSGGGDATPPPHQPGTAPSIPKHPATGTIKVAIAPRGVFGSGDRMTVTAKGFDPGEKVQLVLYYEHEKPIKIGNFAADASGSLSRKLVLPHLDAGTDTVQLTGWDSAKVGTGTFLLGASWVVPQPNAQRTIWLWAGGAAGLAALAALVWFGVASLRRIPAVETGV